FGITNSMLVTWIVAAGVIILAQTAMRKPKRIPGRRQNFWEWLVEGLYNFLEAIIGRKLVQKTFWFFATLFIFILFVNWFGFLPGWMARSSLDPVPSRFPKFPAFRKHLCRRKYPGGNVPDGTGFIMASSHSLLLFRNTCRSGAGASLHAIDRCFHATDRGA